MRENTNGRLLQGKGLQIQINNKTIIEFGSRRIRGIIKASVCVISLDQPSASADNTNLCLNNSSYPTRPHSIIVYYYIPIVKVLLFICFIGGERIT